MAARAELDNAKVSFNRAEQMLKQGVVAEQDVDSARTAYQVAQSKIDSLAKQIDAQGAAVELARSNADQVSVRRSQLQATQKQQAAVAAQRQQAGVRLGYTELRAPIDGIVDVRAARIGEVVTAGQPVVTLINPDDLWVRANVEETYIERVRVGDADRRLAVGMTAYVELPVS